VSASRFRKAFASASFSSSFSSIVALNSRSRCQHFASSVVKALNASIKVAVLDVSTRLSDVAPSSQMIIKYRIIR